MEIFPVQFRISGEKAFLLLLSARSSGVIRGGEETFTLPGFDRHAGLLLRQEFEVRLQCRNLKEKTSET